MAVLALVAAVWWFWYVPKQVEKFYSLGVEQYRVGDFVNAARALEQAHRLDSGAVRVNTLLAWTYWRLGDTQKAESHFAQAHAAAPDSEEATYGLGLALLANRKPAEAVPFLKAIASEQPKNEEVWLALGNAYTQSGQNLAAAKTYREMLQRNPADAKAKAAFLAVYGYPDYRSDLPLTAPAFSRPAQTQMNFRTNKEFFEVLEDGKWKTAYLVGMNLGPARPGEFPSTVSRDFSTYAEWLQQMAEMKANTVRVYTILPPAFYQALKAHNETARFPLWLVQEVWLNDAARDLYDPATKQEFERELTNAIDVIHGQADLKCRPGYHCGIYAADVSPHVIGLALGREMLPSGAIATNLENPGHTSYQGKYVSLKQGSPTEAWFAEMCDRAAGYELEKYNAQRPLTVVNWPPMDPMTHPTEATFAEELRIRKSLGEEVPDTIPPDIDDMDAVSLDVTKFNTEPGFTSGLFALYHAYQHWPDFLLHEPRYAEARDAQGSNRYLGYLQELKAAHTGLPLLIGEYGVSTSWGIGHLHPQGWNNGGATEQQQAELLARFSQNIHSTGCAGGLVFEWIDEWWKRGGVEAIHDFEWPRDRDPLWLNRLDPEENFGVVAYEPSTVVPLLRGREDDWEDAQPFYLQRMGREDVNAAGALKAVYVTSDYAYLYVRLDVQPGPGLNWTDWNFWLALNTLPGQTGSRHLPDINVSLDAGANFLVQLAGPASGRILIARNYNPQEEVAVPGRPGETRNWRKQGMALSLEDKVPFEEMVTEANRPRFARDGRAFPGKRLSRSPLTYGTADLELADHSSLALWHADIGKGVIELRIPWGLLYVMDPSSLTVFGGTDQAVVPVEKQSNGIGIAVFALRKTGKGRALTVDNSFPLLREGKLVSDPSLYAWQPWNQVEYQPRLKQAYGEMKRVFGRLGRPAR